MLGADKTYEATLRLGYVSTTGDAEGEISVASEIEPSDLMPAAQQIEALLKKFTGTITQVPPMYSALKFQGKPMYAYAREGLEIERQPREAIIHYLHIEAIKGNGLRILVKCGSGTYIRTLAEDIGKALGCGGAYLTSLRRSIVIALTYRKLIRWMSLKLSRYRSETTVGFRLDILMQDFGDRYTGCYSGGRLYFKDERLRLFSRDCLYEGQRSIV